MYIHKIKVSVFLLSFWERTRFHGTALNYIYLVLSSQARPLLTRALEDENFDSLVDPRLLNEYDPNEMARMVACTAASIRHSAKRRPRMSQVK